MDELGAPWKTDKLRRAVYQLMAIAKVRKIRPYDARRACLTYLAISGVPDVIVSAWAGHADLSFTKRVYIHPNADHLSRDRSFPALPISSSRLLVGGRRRRWRRR